jgi:hypothetical protein
MVNRKARGSRGEEKTEKRKKEIFLWKRLTWKRK